MNVGHVEPPKPTLGWVEHAVADEFPALWTASVRIPGRHHRRSPREVRERLKHLSGRVDGNWAMELRRQDVPAAFRVFWRHIGIEPDEVRPPMEEEVVQRLRRGGFRTTGMPSDAARIALVETGIPVWAWDAAQVHGAIGIRRAREAESLDGEPARPLDPGTLCIADDERPLTALTGDPSRHVEVGKSTREVVVVALAVAGVSSLYVEEALWIAADLIAEDPAG
ncbi:MAG: B3/4 domain-containing protein [Solirubrobacteraceae bacterium]|nr:B3/4 domain-containing protein [Solirubrobacteraceae bacterium]